MQHLLFFVAHTFHCIPLSLVKKPNLSPFGQRGNLYSSPYAMSLDGRLVRSLVSGVFLVFLALFLIFSCSLFKVFSELCQSYAQQQAPRSVLWCNMEGDPTTYSGPVPSIESVAQGLVFASPDMLNFRHPDHFLAGNLNSCLENWGTILQDSPFQDFVLPIISHGVVISDYFQPFQGIFCTTVLREQFSSKENISELQVLRFI